MWTVLDILSIDADPTKTTQRQPLTRYRDLRLHGTPPPTQSPYCIFRLGNEQHRTQVCHDGGKQPFWNDTIFFNSATDCLLRVQVWDEDAVSDDLVGEGQLDIRQVNNGRDEGTPPTSQKTSTCSTRAGPQAD